MDTNDILNSPEMKELFNEAKWMMLLGLVSDKEIADSSGIGEDVTRPMYEFLKVFYDHGVEADVVVEALEKIQVLASKKEEAVSSSDLTSFIRENLMDYHDYVEKAAENIKNFYKSVKEKTMDKRDNITNIVIEGDGKKTVALVASDKNGMIIETVSAHCAPEDVYNFNIGAKLCMDRLYKDYDFTPKPKRKPFNGKIFVIWDEDVYDTFTVRDGKIESMIYVLRLPCQQKDIIYEDSSFEEMKQALLNCASFVWHSGRKPKAICRTILEFKR